MGPLRTPQLHRQRRELNADPARTQALERLLERRTRELEELKQELDGLLFGLGHDLKAPLRAISGFAQALREDWGASLDEEGRRELERISAAAKEMRERLEGLLELARISRAPLRIEEADLSAIAHWVIDRLSVREPDRSVQAAVEEGIRVRGDPDLLARMLENLIENAWRYTPAGKTVHVELGALRRGGETVYAVRDRGAGFDPAMANRLFVPFQTLHPELARGPHLGLPIVRRIVHRHGGRVWAEGKPNEGASFYFTLGEIGEAS